jgi:hypothetical protein
LTVRDGCSIIGFIFEPYNLNKWEIAMPLCKPMIMTGPPEFPATVALANNTSAGRILIQEVTLFSPDSSQRPSAAFDDDRFIPFEPGDEVQLAMNAVGGPNPGQDLGVNDIDTTTDGLQKTVRFHPGGIQGQFYELTYKVLP